MLVQVALVAGEHGDPTRAPQDRLVSLVVVEICHSQGRRLQTRLQDHPASKWPRGGVLPHHQMSVLDPDQVVIPVAVHVPQRHGENPTGNRRQGFDGAPGSGAEVLDPLKLPIEHDDVVVAVAVQIFEADLVDGTRTGERNGRKERSSLVFRPKDIRPVRGDHVGITVVVDVDRQQLSPGCPGPLHVRGADGAPVVFEPPELLGGGVPTRDVQVAVLIDVEHGVGVVDRDDGSGRSERHGARSGRIFPPHQPHRIRPRLVDCVEISVCVDVGKLHLPAGAFGQSRLLQLSKVGPVALPHRERFCGHQVGEAVAVEVGHGPSDRVCHRIQRLHRPRPRQGRSDKSGEKRHPDSGADGPGYRMRVVITRGCSPPIETGLPQPLLGPQRGILEVVIQESVSSGSASAGSP